VQTADSVNKASRRGCEMTRGAQTNMTANDTPRYPVYDDQLDASSSSDVQRHLARDFQNFLRRSWKKVTKNLPSQLACLKKNLRRTYKKL